MGDTALKRSSVRKDTINMNKTILCEGWRFQKLPGVSPDLRALPEDGYQRVSLPHTWYTDEDPYRGMTAYRHTLETDPEWKNAFLKFDGADQHAWIYINDCLVGEHRGA